MPPADPGQAAEQFSGPLPVTVEMQFVRSSIFRGSAVVKHLNAFSAMPRASSRQLSAVGETRLFNGNSSFKTGIIAKGGDAGKVNFAVDTA